MDAQAKNGGTARGCNFRWHMQNFFGSGPQKQFLRNQPIESKMIFFLKNFSQQLKKFFSFRLIDINLEK